MRKRRIRISIYGLERKRERRCENGDLRMERMMRECGEKRGGSWRLFWKGERKVVRLE